MFKYSKKWYRDLNKAPWTPPDYVFRIVWPILYVFLTISFLLAWKDPKCYPWCNPLNSFLVQIVLNLVWTTLFFGLESPVLALIDLVLILTLSVLNFIEFSKINPVASGLLVPYILWLSYAFTLNVYIVIYN